MLTQPMYRTRINYVFKNIFDITNQCLKSFANLPNKTNSHKLQVTKNCLSFSLFQFFLFCYLLTIHKFHTTCPPLLQKCTHPVLGKTQDALITRYICELRRISILQKSCKKNKDLQFNSNQSINNECKYNQTSFQARGRTL